MGLGIVSDLEFEKELSRGVSTPTPIPFDSIPEKMEIVDNPTKGRGENNNAVPNSLRQIIGETSEIEGRQPALELAKQFGISPSSVSAYANGSTSTKSYDKQPNLNKINDAKERVSVKARNRLIIALNSLTKEKLEDTKAVDLASVARSMSGIIKDMEPETPRLGEGQGNNGPTYIFYAPTLKTEEKYEVINARE